MGDDQLEIDDPVSQVSGDVRKLAARINAEVIFVEPYVAEEESCARPSARVEVGICAPREREVHEAFAERYGERVVVRYLGPEVWVLRNIPWDRVEQKSPVELVVHYTTLLCREPVGARVIETADTVVLTVDERVGVYMEELVRDLRSHTVRLKHPLGARRLVDGART